MSIFEAGQEEGKERGSKRVKVDDGRSPLSLVEAISPVDVKGGGESDDDAEIPEIVMGDSDEE